MFSKSSQDHTFDKSAAQKGDTRTGKSQATSIFKLHNPCRFVHPRGNMI